MSSEKLPTIWPISPHTIAKHQILEEYLKAWFPIIGRGADSIVYLDGFAGPGKYKNGEYGSPVIAIKTAVEHPQITTRTNIIFYFIEKNEERSAILKQTLEEKFGQLPQHMEYMVSDSNFEKSVRGILDELDKINEKLAPTFAFIDSFGYSDFPMEVIKRLISNDKCEVLITFMSGFVNRFLDPEHEDAFTKLYGSNEFLKAKDINGTEDRIGFLLKLYQDSLMENDGMKYTRTFKMIDKNNKILYHLIFGTKHWKGLEVMKKAMLKVDGRGLYSFSDRIGLDQTFFGNMKDDDTWMSDAAELIFEKFRGKTMAVEEIHEFIITDTRYIFKKNILQTLERKNPERILSVRGRKRRMTYPDGCYIEFAT